VAAAIAALGITLALTAAPLAHADGDPASDVLYSTNLFPSYDSGISADNLQALQATLADSKKAGYEIRVAVIAKPDDLGAVTSLWAKPRQYARFLGIELGYVYKKPLLIVMPNGVGYCHANHDSKPGYAAMMTIQSGSGDQLPQAAIASISALARQAGHPFIPHTITASSSSGSSRTPLIAGAAVALLVLVAAAVVAIFRRRRRS